MISEKFVVTNETGLHSRPANMFAKKAKEFECTITITKDDATFDAKSILKIMKAHIVKGSTITITCDGIDEELAIEALGTYIKELKD